MTKNNKKILKELFLLSDHKSYSDDNSGKYKSVDFQIKKSTHELFVKSEQSDFSGVLSVGYLYMRPFLFWISSLVFILLHLFIFLIVTNTNCHFSLSYFLVDIVAVVTLIVLFVIVNLPNFKYFKKYLKIKEEVQRKKDEIKHQQENEMVNKIVNRNPSFKRKIKLNHIKNL